MEISSTESYLTLVLGALDNTVIPELSSQDAKATAEIMKAVLHDLIKREKFTPRLLDEHLAEGRILAKSMAAMLDEAGGKSATAPEEPADQSAATGFIRLAEAHRNLTAVLADLANALVDIRPKVADAARQQFISALLHKAAAWEYAYYSGQRDADGTPPPLVDRRKGKPLNRESLQAFLQAEHPDGTQCRVEGLESIPGGFGKQTYRASVLTASGKKEALIVRKSDPTPMVVYGGFVIEREFHLLKDVFTCGRLPVAEPLYLGVDVDGVDADFYVMSTLPGKVAGSFLGAASAVIPESVMLHMAELMARLHTLGLDTYAGYFSKYPQSREHLTTVEACYRHSIAEWRDYFVRGDHLPSPFVTYMLDWLEQHIPANKNPPVLVHGDFNIHNVLAEDGRVAGVLDWECAMFGAPEQDLAYIKPIISKHIAWDRFLGHYRDSGGPAIDESAMNFYMAFSAMRLNIIFNKGTRNMQQGITRDIRYAIVELGLQTEFMNLALASTAGGLAS